MGIVHVCFIMHSQMHETELNNIEQLYQSSYKKLLTFLYSHPKFQFTFHLSGPFLEWLSKYHEEVIELLSELSNRKQTEFLGGGYYDPLFPLILPVDRAGQIELLTTNLRKLVGKRPRGIFLPNSVWDPSLLSCFKTCGIEYLVLDSRLIETDRHSSLSTPKIIEDMGKTLSVIPLRQDMLPDSSISPEQYYKKIIAQGESEKDAIFCISLSPDQITDLASTQWLERFYELVTSSSLIDFSIPSRYLKINQICERVFIPPGCIPCISLQDKNKPATIRNFLYSLPETQALYARMMYVSLLVNQYRGDKSRKKSAREFLWQAQNSNAFLFHEGNGIRSYYALQETAFRHLLQAEKSVRDIAGSGITESSISFDYDMDGLKEYLFHQADYNAFISAAGGILFELDVLSSNRNYCNTIQRVKKYDCITDSYSKKMFIDHFIEDDCFPKFLQDASQTSAIFSQIQYTEISFDSYKKEVQLKASALFGLLQQPVSLKKIYSLSKNGIRVQYIIKNNSPLPLKAKFAVESNVSILEDASEQVIELISNEKCEQIDPSKYSVHHTDISLLQITDNNTNNSFIFEPNEVSGLSIQPLTITRPLGEKLETFQQATTFCFFWDLTIAPGYEIEKMLFLGIKSSKKTASSKRKKQS